MKAKAALAAAVARLQAAGLEGAARDARVLLSHALAVRADRLTLHLDDWMDSGQTAAFEAALARREARQPVAQIIGHRLFWGLSFRVTADTLDPRPETETLVAEALSQPFQHALDLGTGTGCILLSCLKDMPAAQGLGVDISPAALEVAKANARDLGLDDRARFVASDWFSAVSGTFDLILSNPPYISAAEMTELAPEVHDWEPHLALTPGGDGLEAYRQILHAAATRLTPGGRLLLEIGPTQGRAVTGLLQAAGYGQIRILSDLDGRDRVIAVIRPTRPGEAGPGI
ncbi:MAG: peptide chain release factor N(5)-glutamine methyltransferase [Paracoccaceae bacterium]